MARKKSDSEENLDLFEVAPDELDDALADLPTDDAQLTIYRCRSEGQGHPIFVATYPPSEFSLELIQQNHGGGKYNIYAKRDRQIVKRLRVEIEGEPKILGVIPMAARRDPYKYSGWRNKLQLEEEEQKAKMSGVDPTTFMLLNEIKNLKESLKEIGQNAGNAGGGFDRKAFMQELIMFKELFSPSNPVADQTGMISTILQKGLEIGARAANGDVGGSSWVDTIKELIPVAQQALSAFANKTAIEQAARVRSIPQAANVMPENVNRLSERGFGAILPDMNSQAVPAGGFAAIAPTLKTFIPLVIGTASRDGDPSGIIELIESNMTAEQKPRVLEWLSSPVWYTDLCSLDPRIELQAAWWGEFHEMLLAQLSGVTIQDTSENGAGKEDDNENI